MKTILERLKTRLTAHLEWVNQMIEDEDGANAAEDDDWQNTVELYENQQHDIEQLITDVDLLIEDPRNNKALRLIADFVKFLNEMAEIEDTVDGLQEINEEKNLLEQLNNTRH
jgi:hypothetical protein